MFRSACVLGLKAIGEIEDFSIVSSMVGATHNHTPIEENAAIYQELVAVFINLSRSLTEIMNKLQIFNVNI